MNIAVACFGMLCSLRWHRMSFESLEDACLAQVWKQEKSATALRFHMVAER